MCPAGTGTSGSRGRDEPQVEREFLAQPRGVGHRAGAAGERRGHLRPGPQVRGAGGG